MRTRLSRYCAAVLSSWSVPDVGAQLITWCAVLALLGLGVGVSRRRRMAGVALGVALLLLGHLFWKPDRRLSARTVL